MKRLNMRKRLLFGFGLIVLGILLVVLQLHVGAEYPYTPTGVEAEAQAMIGSSKVDDGSSQDQKVIGLPIQLDVARANIHVPVRKGYYNQQTQKWTLSRNDAFYAVMSAPPNEVKGTTFIYGHNRSSVFSRLFSLKVGEVATITTTDNRQFSYRLIRQFTTNPYDSQFLDQVGPPTLMLQTCSGPNFQNRTLFVFELVGVSHA